MDWLTKLPVIGPVAAALMRTHAWRSYERLDRVHWTRLAAAITFISFLAVFPLLTVAAAIGAALLSQEQLDKLEKSLTEQVPGISDQLDINGLVANAGTVGLVAGVILLFAGISWVGAMRDCLRAVWDKDDEDEGNPVARKGKDTLVLLGLGAAGLASAAASIIGSSAVGKFGGWLGIPQHGVGGWVLRAAAFLVGVVAAFLLLLYVLTLLPGVEPPRGRLIQAALIGAAGFELLKLLLSGYIREVAAKSMYGAFGVPIALLLWINFTAKLLLYCSAWTATRDDGEERDEPDGPDDTDGREEPAATT
ncbi:MULTISPECIES: YihY/virulence factor BrkB family protein [unclassified Streptomyces]|uniref:YihY/virulence factor BrkB family protein n=1 Tax=unclassified Streptomyces TaxID=2593676 RepID=UPI00225662B7|nr:MULTISPECIES: YihY/virulence factor BrkB family protein [unclassified Streptomyces]MCX4527653.1 YihY/virulence factor BrkB family protein [Streptomyces sp. NBC_01551]MCX4541749.1 YihY/virulence factor BrkB family protein [Streptomyces sp. NBC_01565]